MDMDTIIEVMTKRWDQEPSISLTVFPMIIEDEEFGEFQALDIWLFEVSV